MNKTAKRLGLSGSMLLIIMALFHGSGLVYTTELIHASNAQQFLKDIFPVLFIQPSLHLLGLAAFGIIATYLGHQAGRIWWLVAILTGLNALLAFYLKAWAPGGLLVVTAFIFILAALQIQRTRTSIN